MSKQGSFELAPQPQGPELVLTAPATDRARLSLVALLLAGVSSGRSRLVGLAEGADLTAAAQALVAMGVRIERSAADWLVAGAGNGAFLAPRQVLDFQQAPHAFALFAGLASSYDFPVTCRLGSAPDPDLLSPFAAMGAQVQAPAAASQSQSLPCNAVLHGPRSANPISWMELGVSEDIAAAVLLAGLNAQGRTAVLAPREPERLIALFQSFGAKIGMTPGSAGPPQIAVTGRRRLMATQIVFKLGEAPGASRSS
jgi:3-phosphoshikimate 1-carboxyvinyltransferase